MRDDLETDELLVGRVPALGREVAEMRLRRAGTVDEVACFEGLDGVLHLVGAHGGVELGELGIDEGGVGEVVLPALDGGFDELIDDVGMFGEELL